MTKKIPVSIGLALAAAVVATASVGHANDRSPVNHPVPDCTISAETPLVLGSAELEYKVKPSEVITGEMTATFPDDAKIKVASAAVDGDLIKLVVNTTEGVAGDWALTLRAGEASCTGNVKVVAPSDDQ